MDLEFKHTAEYVRRDVEAVLNRCGVLCRVFGRGKDSKSLHKKINIVADKYKVGGKLIQDAIGVRIVFYFSEDIHIVENILKKNYVLDRESSTIDLPATDQFSVTRHNLVFGVPEDYLDGLKRIIGNHPIDLTFEVQLRSVLSEGWHEVDHDLRYKTKSNWADHDDLSRALNGILATLETSEWSMRKIFDDLTYRHYKRKNWAAMMHSKIRMRSSSSLSDSIVRIFNDDVNIAKEQLRLNRKEIIECFASIRPSLPVTLDNVVYMWNLIGTKNSALIELTPILIKDAVENWLLSKQVRM